MTRDGRGRHTTRVRSLVQGLPDAPGVYLFYDTSGDLLYVGKSKSIRTRVRAHFSARDEKQMCRKVEHIEVRETAGELGALLLESKLIKELRPMYNRLARHKRRIILARTMITPQGYRRVVLEAVNQIDPSCTGNILAIFKTTTQAKTYLAESAKKHRLCPKLLGLESTKRFCFAYHLHLCNGACMGLESPAQYNGRLEQAFEDRRMKAWPFTGGVIIEERRDDGSEGEIFVVDNWCLLYSFTYSHRHNSISVRGLHRFDYDSYRILAGYVFDEENRNRIRPAGKEEIEALIRQAHAA